MKKQILKISLLTAILFLIVPIPALANSIDTFGANNFTDSSATLHGSFSVDVKDKSVPTWFEYSYRDANFGNNDPRTKTPEETYSAKANKAVSFSKTADNLFPNTTYYYRACFRHGLVGVEDCAGNVSFKTLQAVTVPIPATNDATNMSGTGAKLKGSWTSNGTYTYTWFEYGTSDSLTDPLTNNTTFQPDMPYHGGSGSVSQGISGLNLDTTYYFRLVTQNKAGTSYGEIKNFKTLSTYASSSVVLNEENPYVTIPTTVSANNISDTTATLFGSGTPDTEPTTAYFRYSSTPIAPVFCNDIYGSDMISTEDTPLAINGGTQSFYRMINGLTENTKYYYCAIVSSKNGINYGLVKDFTTLPCSTCSQTTITTKAATNIGQTSVYLNGSYSSTIANKTYFEYAKDTGTNQFGAENVGSAQKKWTKINSSAQNHYANTYGDAKFLLTGLQAGVKYDFRLTAETIVTAPNVSEIFYGYPSLSFTTKSSSNPILNPDIKNGLTFTPTIIPKIPTNGGNGPDNVDGGGIYIPKTPLGTGGNTLNQGGSYNNGNSNGGSYIGGGTGTATPHTLGEVVTAPIDAIVHQSEGIETVLARQIIANSDIAEKYGYTEGKDLQSFAWTLADLLARSFGYVNSSGKQIRVSKPEVAAYELQMTDGVLTVYEYYNSKIVNIQKLSSTIRSKYFYEYYYKK